MNTPTFRPKKAAVRPVARAACCASALLAIGCGATEKLPRAAEPADSPPQRERPAGRIAPVGAMPEGIAFDSRAGLFAVGLRDPDQLAFVDPSTLKVRRRVSLPAAPRHLAYSSSKPGVIVPAESANDVLTVAPDAGLVSSTPVSNHPHDAAVADSRIFVADEHSDQVSVVERGAVIATLPAPRQPGGIAAIGNRFVVLVAVGERVLEVYDAKTLMPLGTTSAGTGPTHVSTLGTRAYVVDTQGGLIRQYAITAHPHQTATASAPGAPYGIDVDRRRRRLWVTLTATNRLVEYSVGGRVPHRVGTYSTVRQPNSVAVDPRTGDVFVLGRADGQIERISP